MQRLHSLPVRLALLVSPQIRSGGYILARQLSTIKKKKRTLYGDEQHSLLLGAYQGPNGFVLTQAAQTFDLELGGELTRCLAIANMEGKANEVRILQLQHDHVYRQVGVTGLGKKESRLYDDGVEPWAHSVRCAVAAGMRMFRSYGAKHVEIDTMGAPKAAGEGAQLGIYSYDLLKSEDKRVRAIDFLTHQQRDESEFNEGVVMGKAQNLTRELMETPANLMTPTLFANKARLELCRDFAGKIKIEEHDEKWAREHKMGAFLGVAKGSDEPLRFLEIEYIHDVPEDTPPVVMVGKGITFDSGGISIKPSNDMGMMRADMGGAANVLGAIQGLANLGAKGRVIGVIPLTENMPSGRALKPGDVVTAANGLTIEVDNTDAEGRLVLADALVHAQTTYNPRAMISIATLTGAMVMALGEAATGVFTPSNSMWKELKAAGYITGERVWRMPLYRHYANQMESSYCDLTNLGGRSAGACTAAAFLRNFGTMHEYAHLDIAGVMHMKGNRPGMACPYLYDGMQGRPVRALIEYAKNLHY